MSFELTLLEGFVNQLRIDKNVAGLALAASEFGEIDEPLGSTEIDGLRDIEPEIKAAVVGRGKSDDEFSRLLNLSF